MRSLSKNTTLLSPLNPIEIRISVLIITKLVQILFLLAAIRPREKPVSSNYDGWQKKRGIFLANQNVLLFRSMLVLRKTINLLFQLCLAGANLLQEVY